MSMKAITSGRDKKMSIHFGAVSLIFFSSTLDPYQPGGGGAHKEAKDPE